MRTYDTAALSPLDPTSTAWALATCRRFLRDVPNDLGAYTPRSYQDAELQAQLELDAATHAGATFYRPHVSAAFLLRTDPERVQSFSGGGYSEQYPDPDRAADRMLKGGRSIDDLINDLAGAPVVPTGRTFETVL